MFRALNPIAGVNNLEEEEEARPLAMYRENVLTNPYIMNSANELY